MDEEEEKKRKWRKRLKKLLRKPRPRLGIRGSRGRAYNPKLRPRINPHKSRRPTKPKVKPKIEKTHWSGKVEPWTEPQKQKIRKIVKHEVDTEKLFKDLEQGNEETLNKLAERIEEDISNIQQRKVENEEPEVDAEAKVENDNILTSALTTDTKEADDEPLDSDELDLQELLDETDENIEDEIDPMYEPTEEYEATQSEDLEAEQTTTNELEDGSDFGAERVLFNPDFWQEIGNDLWGELEQIEPEAEYAPIEEAPME